MDSDVRDEIMKLLANALANNLGQTLTAELATGIATLVGQKMAEAVKPA